jgi:hypothetical protein
MTPDRLKSKMFPPSPSPSPLKTKSVPVNKRTNEIDLGEDLSGYGLQGVKVTEDELRDLMAELGLEGDEAGDLVKGLSGATTPPKKANPVEDSKDTTKRPDKEKASTTKLDGDKGDQGDEALPSK